MSKLCKKFLVITFLIMIVCWGCCLIFSINGILLNKYPVLYLPYCLGVWSPTIASYITMKSEGQVKKFKDWLKIIFDYKQPIISYLTVFILGIVFILPQCLISGYSKGAPLIAIIPLMPFMLFGGGLEEAGWRCILQPELEKKYSFTLSTIMLSVIWWLWHLPLFFLEGVGQYGTSYVAFGITVLGLSFVLAAIRKVPTSVCLCLVLHSFVNSLLEIYIINKNIKGNIVTAILLIAAAYLLILLNKKNFTYSSLSYSLMMLSSN